MPVPRQPLSRYQLYITGIAPRLKLARYNAVCKCRRESDFSTWALVEIYNQITTAPVPQKDLQKWRGNGISTVYHQRGFERQNGWNYSIPTGAVMNIGTMPAMKSVLVQYWYYSGFTWYLVLGLRTEAVLCQYCNNPRPGTNCPVQALLLVYNWRGTMPFVNTGINPTFPPGPWWKFTTRLLRRQYRRSIFSTGAVLA